MKRAGLTFVVACLFLGNYVFATSKLHTFLFHQNPVFIETGSFHGQGIQHALIAGFDEIHSIELSPKYYTLCKEKFQNNPQIFIHKGDSGKILYDTIKDIDEPMTFWLDGHCSGDDTAYGEGMTPILQELEQIKRHHINTHTILIDDVRQFGTWHFDYITKEQIIEKIYEINPNYTITYADGFAENDILIAEMR